MNPINRRQLLRSGLGLTLLTGLSALDSSLTSSWAAATSPDITHGPRNKAEIALTFHGAGTPANAKSLLGILRAAKVPVSVFAVGTWLKAEPTLAKVILDDGHDLGNHTFTHTQMKSISAARVDSEIKLCANELISLTGTHGSWFRPSGTQYSTALIRKTAQKYGYKKCISYEVDSHDYQDPGKAAVIKNTMNSIKNGSIVSLHFGHQDTIDALPNLLEKIHSKGLTPVTLTQLLGKI